MTGKTFGRLTVLSQATHSACGRFLRWKCRCECGNETVVHGGALKSGNSKSCGCLSIEKAGQSQRTHGEGYRETKEYKTWLRMKARCYRPTDQKYGIYGGRGIRVCDRWLADYGNFLADMGRAPSRSHSIDRIDTNGHYEPSNCRWANAREQMNNVRYNHLITKPDGTRATVAEVARQSGVKYSTVLLRANKGWPYERIIAPV